MKIRSNVADERLGIAREAPEAIAFEDFAALWLDRHGRHKASYADDLALSRRSAAGDLPLKP